MGNTYNRVYILCCKYGENRYCERCANKKWCASKHTGLLNSCSGKLCLQPYLVVPLISARVPLISTRVSAHCQAILLETPLNSQAVQKWIFTENSWKIYSCLSVCISNYPCTRQVIYKSKLFEVMAWCHHEQAINSTCANQVFYAIWTACGITRGHWVSINHVFQFSPTIAERLNSVSFFLVVCFF